MKLTLITMGGVLLITNTL